MQRVVIDPLHPEPRKIAFVVDKIGRGSVVAYPTDSVYGLGCDMSERSAVERLYQLKHLRDERKLAFLFPDITSVAHYAVLTDDAYRLCKRIFPGPYTLILPARREVPRALMDRRKTVGVRIPNHPITLALVRGLGRPILNTSAIFDEMPLWDPDEVRDNFENGLDVLVDGGPSETQVSTVISLINDKLEIVREGAGPVDIFEE